MKLIDKNAATIACKKVCEDMIGVSKVLILITLSCLLFVTLITAIVHGFLGMTGETVKLICWIIAAIMSAAVLVFFIEYDIARESMKR